MTCYAGAIRRAQSVRAFCFLDTPLQLILASSSPRRRELLALLGLPFRVEPSRFDEPPPPTEPVSLPELVTFLATQKAQEVAQRLALNSEGFVIGADTLVAPDAEIGSPFGKPIDPADARRMLAQLSGNTHRVYTGVAVIPLRDQRAHAPTSIAVYTRVTFREMTPAMIADYVATGEPMDKAGAYGAQGYAAPFIERIEGDFFNVVGLPLCALGRLLESLGLDWNAQRFDSAGTNNTTITTPNLDKTGT
jgi:septum formation protein